MRMKIEAVGDPGAWLCRGVTATIAIAAAAFLLLAAARLTGLVNAERGVATRDTLLAAATGLNLALLLFAWRRHRAGGRTIAVRTPVTIRPPVTHDPLTSCLDRAALVAQGTAELARCARTGQALTLAMIDLDRFKIVTDLHGHAAGDQLLCAAAQAIRAELPPAALLARLGGDAFACLFPVDRTRLRDAESVAERIVACLAQPFEIGAIRAHLSASVGLVRPDADAPGIDALIRRANIALSAARKAGRGRHAWFEPAMEHALHARHAIEQGLRVGIPLGQFVPYYEQQVDLASGALLGFEVLARWHHPTGGVIAPDAFIAIAEESGLLGDLSLSVMRQAFEQARGWDPALTLSCNVSPAQLKDPWLAEKIVKLLVETGFPAARLEIEITETALFENLAVAQSIIASLKNQGIRIALDDFGTGYSSLAHLRALPFDRIKIDRSFVTAMLDDAESAAIVGAVVQLGESLRLPIVAEGVETAGIEARLLELGLRKGQGWLWGRPMPIAATRRLLAERGLIPVARGLAPPAAGMRRVG